MQEQLYDFVQGFSIEITPKGALKVACFSDYLVAGTRVYVTALAGSDSTDTLNTCKRLQQEGMIPVPHFTVRRFKNRNELERALAAASEEAGVNQVLVLAGADKQAAGEFCDTISMLETGLFEKYNIQSIGIAGHPEGSPEIEQSILREHCDKKVRFSELTDNRIYRLSMQIPCFPNRENKIQ